MDQIFQDSYTSIELNNDCAPGAQINLINNQVNGIVPCARKRTFNQGKRGGRPVEYWSADQSKSKQKSVSMLLVVRQKAETGLLADRKWAVGQSQTGGWQEEGNLHLWFFWNDGVTPH